ncbi:MAG: ATP-binding cassette domain-containing protein [Acetobacter fabarum]|uniref:Iron transporter n=1 Tax=Acetobacter fabarum TaxID=483199 RepID=A0A269XYK7_9PROT|nr:MULTISPECIES: ATP-binding cassette domain-containing protein [Acetobacter]MCI1244292.1 ATP-binding cassette domain-containing protein [Acetobacter fabarum]MCI1910134.1 ATP-binding cassette domain-containing protein [Acetobacter fabarum]MCI1928632.1 ATP-binding cassette domain-containing protein [Acetobacter fabarum]MCI1948654.1 ATP-binding cassette domain-containing protein [Acetobacter fabarum]MCI1989639.1 ATP-binding cassette domain-containing protein [Acetobacter fabarum]
MSTPAIEAGQLSVSYGGRRVLDQVSFAIPPGSFVAVLGGNGAGKTSLFRAILGLTTPEQGYVRVEGQSFGKGRMPVGYMPQMRRMVAGQLNGWHMVAAALQGRAWGLPWCSASARAEVNAALDAVDAQDLAMRPVMSLSGGERQRLLLAQALLDQPRILLLDEPLASLDPARMRETTRRIYDLARERGLTVLFSTHDINPLMGFMDHVLYLAHGKALLGSVDEVMTTPALSALYGAPVEVVRADGRLFVVADGGADTLHCCDCAEHTR